MIRLIISIFSLVGMTLGMDWRPSRAQHSQTVTDLGRGMVKPLRSRKTALNDAKIPMKAGESTIRGIVLDTPG